MRNFCDTFFGTLVAIYATIVISSLAGILIMVGISVAGVSGVRPILIIFIIIFFSCIGIFLIAVPLFFCIIECDCCWNCNKYRRDVSYPKFTKFTTLVVPPVAPPMSLEITSPSQRIDNVDNVDNKV